MRDAIAETIATRSFTEPNTGCRIWTGALSHGYGNITIETKSKRAHRVAWELENGPIPEGIDVLHRCDTPPCINPDHLWLGDDKDNLGDAARKGRMTRGERISWSILTERDVVEIRNRYAAGGITQTALAKEFGVHVATLSQVVRHKTWKHVK